MVVRPNGRRGWNGRVEDSGEGDPLLLLQLGGVSHEAGRVVGSRHRL